MKYVFGIAIVVTVVTAGWQILEPEITNIVFQDELHDMAAQVGYRIGMSGPSSDGELRNLVIRRAERHDISLHPEQVTVRRSGTTEKPALFIAVDYMVPVNLIVYSYNAHFKPTSAGNKF